MTISRIDLEQLRKSSEYNDQLSAGPQNETQGVDFNYDFNAAISAIRRIIHGNLPSGNGNWYDAPSIGLSGLHQLALSSSMPSWNNVFDYGSGILNVDAYHADVRLDPGRTWRFTNTAGTTDIMVVSNSGVDIRQMGRREVNTLGGDSSPGSTHTIPNGALYTFGDSKFRNLKVYRNGQLLLPGTGISNLNQNFNDYRELNSSQVVNNYKWKSGDVIQFVING